MTSILTGVIIDNFVGRPFSAHIQAPPPSPFWEARSKLPLANHRVTEVVELSRRMKCGKARGVELDQ